MQPLCIGCGQQGATEPDGLCRPCAREGSLVSGMWQVGVWLDGDPATTPDQVRQVLGQLDWPSSEFGELDPEQGVWLLQLPELARGLLLSQGYVCQAAGHSRVEVELP